MAVESNVYGLWAAKQSAKGSVVAGDTSQRRFVQVAGDFVTNRDDGSENFSDATRFGDSADFINTLVGQGNPTIEATPNEVAWLCYIFFGAETYTAKVPATSPPKYVFEPGSTTGFWTTWWKRVGLSDVVRHKYGDSKITALRFEGSTANKVVKVIPTITSLDPGIVRAADPATAMPTQKPFLYTEGQGNFTLDGTVFTGHSQFAFTFDDAQSPWYGDKATPHDLVAGNAQVNLEGITLLLDSASIGRYNNIIYGTATPAADAKPIAGATAPITGSYSVDLVRGATDARERLKIEIPKVKWTPDMTIPPNPDGGAVEIALGGQMRNNTGSTPLKARITVETGTGDDVAHS